MTFWFPANGSLCRSTLFEHLSQYFINPRVHQTDNVTTVKPMKFRTFWYQTRYWATTCGGLNRHGEISENTIHKHGKIDKQKITPLSYENICDKSCVKRLKECLALKYAELHGLPGGVIICCIGLWVYDMICIYTWKASGPCAYTTRR